MKQRIVIKVGTTVLTSGGDRVQTSAVRHIADQVAAAKQAGHEVVLVSSGAVGAGRSHVSLPELSHPTVQKQVYAAIGQAKLIAEYDMALTHYDLHCAQILVTKEDFRDRSHALNMRSCLEGLLLDNVVPIVNENDVIAIEGLIFTDNDELAGHVASLLNADTVILLSSVAGLLDDAGKVIPTVGAGSTHAAHVRDDLSAGGRGGMLSKYAVAQTLAAQGIEVYIAEGKRAKVVADILAGSPVGTHFLAQSKKNNLKRRIAFSAGLTKGVAHVNACAVDVLTDETRVASLLPVGVTVIEGEFARGDVLEVKGPGGESLGFGLARYGSKEALANIGVAGAKPLIHYDQLFIKS